MKVRLVEPKRWGNIGFEKGDPAGGKWEGTNYGKCKESIERIFGEVKGP